MEATDIGPIAAVWSGFAFFVGGFALGFHYRLKGKK